MTAEYSQQTVAGSSKGTMRRRSTLIGATLAALLLLLAACGSSKSSSSTTTAAKATTTTSSLPAAPQSGVSGTSWKLVPSSLGVTVPASTEVTLAFASGKASGTSGCNRFSGPYIVSGTDGLKFGDLAQTMMACPPAESAVESAVTTKLGKVARYEIVNNQLGLLDAFGKTLLTYDRG